MAGRKPKAETTTPIETIIENAEEESVVNPTETKVINTNEKVKKVTTRRKAGETVMVAYNGVHGQLFEVPVGNTIKKVVINGNNADLIGKSKGELYAGGFGLTEVDKDAWDWIKEAYKEWGPIKNGLMFASTASNVADEAKERADLRNGYEPLDKSLIKGVEEKGTN